MTVQSIRTTRARDRRLSALLIVMLVGCQAAAAPDPDIEESAQLPRRFQTEPTVAAAVIPANETFPEWHPKLLRHLVGGGFRDDSTLGFQLAHSAVIMGDGSIFLASYRPPFVRYPAARGKVAHLGVAGEGPGEYRQIQWIARFRGDSLRIWDGILRRLATLDPEGRVVAEARPSPKLRDALEFWPSRLFDDGRLLAIGRGGVPQGAGNLILRGDLLLVDSSNSVVESLAKDLPLGEMHLKEAPNQPGMDRSYSVVTPPFTRYGLTAAGGQRWCYTWTGGADLYCGGTTGQQVVSVRDTVAHRLVDDSTMVRHLDELGVLEGAGDQREARIVGWKQHWTHDFLPRWSRMVMDDQERIWLQRYRNPLDSQEQVIVLDRHFAPVARFVLERGWQLLAARGQIAVVAKRTGSGGVAKVLSLSSGGK